MNILAQFLEMALRAQGDAQNGSSSSVPYLQAKDALRGFIQKDPIDANLSFIAVASLLFFRAEKDINPKVNTLGDALIYISTCLSVGYSDIFAKTETGKLIGSIAMTLGPSMSQRFLDAPGAPRDRVPPLATGTGVAPRIPSMPTPGASTPSIDPALLSTLDTLLTELQRVKGVEGS